MRQVNFVVIFVISLALVLFGLENTDMATIHVYSDLELTAPLCVELILSAGIGAVLAWVFSVWTGLQRKVQTQAVDEKVQAQEIEIQELRQDVARYKAEVEQQKLLPSASGNS